MNKTPQKVKRYRKRQEAVRKGREKCMNKLKEGILNNAKKVLKILVMQAIPTLPPAPPPAPRPQTMVISMALVLLPF